MALREHLERGANQTEIARWAYQVYLDERDTTEGVDECLLTLVAMEEGPQFEMSFDELRQLASELEKD